MKLIIIFIAIIVTVSVVHAQLPENPYIGLFIDQDRSSSCVTGTPFYQFEMWIWCLPSSDGQMCAEFAIQYPANVIESTVTKNESIISVDMGNLADGVSVCYTNCQWDWNWNYHQTLYITDSESSWIEIISYPDVGEVDFISCA